MGDWIRAYNASPLSELSKPALALQQLAQDCKFIVCSDLSRSIESAERIGKDKILLKSPQFSEAGLPYSNRVALRLPPLVWAAIFRVLWLLGYASNAESYGSAKIRAKQALSELVQLSKEYGHIMYIGHGIFNRLIVKELLKNGWRGSKRPSREYWGFTNYET
jgi:broad specificity phosphatase PhoE